MKKGLWTFSRVWVGNFLKKRRLKLKSIMMFKILHDQSAPLVRKLFLKVSDCGISRFFFMDLQIFHYQILAGLVYDKDFRCTCLIAQGSLSFLLHRAQRQHKLQNKDSSVLPEVWFLHIAQVTLPRFSSTLHCSFSVSKGILIFAFLNKINKAKGKEKLPG